MFSPYLTQGDIRLDSCVADGGHRLGTASGGEAVTSPLTQRLRLPETLAQSPQMKAKPVMTNKLGRPTRRWNLQMCSPSASRNKSRCGVQIEFHYSSAKAPFSLGQAGADGQKIHFMSSALYMESRC